MAIGTWALALDHHARPALEHFRPVAHGNRSERGENEQTNPNQLFFRAHFVVPSGCRVMIAFTGKFGMSNATPLLAGGGGGA
jgi:hypothetical protein